ncbi:MAG: hypothetical protein WC893_01260 [Candidatus Paceibacterota bacterium]
MFLLLSVIARLLYGSSKQSNNQAVKSLFIIFFFYSIYYLILGTFIIFGQNKPYILIAGYNFAILFAFGALFFVTRIPTFSENKFIKNYLRHISILTLLIGAIILTIQLIDMRSPIIGKYGVIFWNQNPIAIWLTIFTILSYMIAWAYFSCKNIKIIQDKQQRLKLYALSLDAVSVGFSALIYFPSQNEWQSLASFLLIIPAYIFTIFSLVQSRKEKMA